MRGFRGVTFFSLMRAALLLLLGLGLGVYGVYVALYSHVVVIKCQEKLCQLLHRPLVAVVLSDDQVVQQWTQDSSIDLRVELKLAKGRGLHVAQLSRLVLRNVKKNESVFLCDWTQGHTNMHEWASKKHNENLDFETPPLSGRVYPVVGVALLMLFSLVLMMVSCFVAKPNEEMKKKKLS